MAAPEQRVISDFEIVTKLCSGGMGDVLLARRRGAHGFEKLFAIKTIRGEYSRRADIRSMFHDEARLVARLHHPRIAQVYDFGEDRGTIYIAMEYISGIALNKLLVKYGGPLPPLIAAQIIAEVCRGLHAAHELTDLDGKNLGVVHRDVTHGNMMLTFDGQVKILDFGIAFMHHRESPDTQLGELKGKPSYMSPEQIRCEGVDRRSDIYSASVVLHELLTGRKLFTRNNVVATVMAVERGEVRPPSELVGPLPGGLDEIVMQGLERRPENRFADARSMADAIDGIVIRDGSEKLETFIERVLSSEREAHREWLQAVLRGEAKDRTFDDVLETIRRESSLSGAGSSSPSSSSSAPSSTSSPLPSSSASFFASSSRASRAEHGRKRAGWITDMRVKRPWAWVASGIVGLLLLSAYGAMQWAVPIAREAPIPPMASTEIAPAERSQNDEMNEPIREPEEELSDTAAESGGSASESARIEPVAITTLSGDHAQSEAKTRKGRTSPLPKRPLRALSAEGRERAGRAEAAESSAKPSDESERSASPRAFGFITVGATPYALVRINGEDAGVTPIMAKRLSVGDHVVQLVSPDTGDIRLTRLISVVEDEHIRITLP